MYSRRSRYSPRSPSPYYHSGKHTRSLSPTPSRSRSRSRSRDFTDVVNPGNNLYVTGLSPRISKLQLEEHFSSEGKVLDIHLVIDPYTKESRGFGFVTMASIVEAEKCIKYLDGSVLEGRAITVEKAKRRRGRTPTPGRYLGLRAAPARCHRSSSYSPYHKSRFSSFDRERSDSSDYYGRSRSHRRRRYHHSSLEYSRSPSLSVSPRVDRRWRSHSRSTSPPSRRRMCRRRYSKSISPRLDGWLRSYSRSISPAAARRRIYRRSYSRSISPSSYRRSSHLKSYHRNYSRSISPRSMSSGRSPSPKRGYSHSRSPSSCFRGNYSRSVSPRKSSRRSYRRNNSPAAKKRMHSSYSRSITPRSISSGRSPSPEIAFSKMKRGYSRESYSHSRSLSPNSRSGTR